MTWTFGPAELKKNSIFTFISNNILDLDKFLCVIDFLFRYAKPSGISYAKVSKSSTLKMKF
jgi:hypothetical protein